MRAVNLLPRDVEQSRSQGGRTPLLVAAGGLAAVTAAFAVMFMSASGSVSEQREQLRSVEAQIERIPKAQTADTSGTIAQERTDRSAALSAALATRTPVDRLLREIAYVLPRDAWLTGFTATAPAPSAPAAPGTPLPSGTQGVSISGATYSHRSVARVLSRLAAIPALANVRLSASARVTVELQPGKKKGKKKQVVTFVVTADLPTQGTA